MITTQISKEYRQFQNKTSWYKHATEGNAGEFSYLALGLAGEAGETADEFKKMIRISGVKDDAAFQEELGGRGMKMLHEMGDTMWYLTKLCTVMGITPDELMIMNTVKLYDQLLRNGRITVEDTPWPFSSISRALANDVVYRIEKLIRSKMEGID